MQVQKTQLLLTFFLFIVIMNQVAIFEECFFFWQPPVLSNRFRQLCGLTQIVKTCNLAFSTGA